MDNLSKKVNGVKFQVFNFLNHPSLSEHVCTKNLFFSTQMNAIYLGSVGGKILEGIPKEQNV